jgi:Xaa-Pro aminopeptidase
MSSTEVVLIDPERLNFALYSNIPEQVKRIEKTNPCILFKAIKNETEIQNIKKAHLKDAVAHTKFMYWLKTTLGNEIITELSASDKLESFRMEQENFLWPSFAPISAYGEHAAMCHYSSSEETNVELKEGTLFLTDTGGNYLEGSTDITRTVALGKIPSEMKRHFTNVLRGNLALSNAKFLYGCSGKNLDILARQYLWNEHLDFNHGTGHGVGYLLSIHENGGRFNWRTIEETMRPLEEGMIITDEPGIYKGGRHGIRIENTLLIVPAQETEFGKFYQFEPLTLCPIDKKAIVAEMLTDEELAWFNDYHQMVYSRLYPLLNEEEQAWLKEATSPLKR